MRLLDLRLNVSWQVYTPEIHEVNWAIEYFRWLVLPLITKIHVKPNVSHEMLLRYLENDAFAPRNPPLGQKVEAIDLRHRRMRRLVGWTLLTRSSGHLQSRPWIVLVQVITDLGLRTVWMGACCRDCVWAGQLD